MLNLTNLDQQTAQSAEQCLDLNAHTTIGNNPKGSQMTDAGILAIHARDEINMLQGLPNVNTSTDLGSNNKGNAGMESNATNGSVSGWPFIQTWEMDATSTVCYGSECINVSFGSANSETAISVNKQVVQDNDHIILEITDPGLNLDPTFPDEWTFTATESTPATTWRGNATDSFGQLAASSITQANLLVAGFGDGGYLSVTDAGAALGNPVAEQVTVYETGANTGVFTTLMVNDTSDIVTGTRANASSDDVITINYAGNKVNLVVAYTDMSMTLDAGDEWAPGEAATLTIVDPDANKMSTSAETLNVSDEAQSIPTITLGSPYYCNNNGQVSVSDSAGDDGDHVTSQSLTSTDDKRCKFKTTSVTDSGTMTHVNVTIAHNAAQGTTDSAIGDNIAAWENSGSVYVGFDVSEIADAISTTAAVTTIEVHLSTNETDSTGDGLTQCATGVGASDCLIATGGYDNLVLSTGNSTSKGVYLVQDIIHSGSGTNATALDHTANPVVQITLMHAAATLPADTYAISADIMHFDQDNSSVAHDAVYRIEAVETGADTGVFEGTVAYANMNAANGDNAMQDTIVQNNQNVILGIHSGVSGTDAPRVEYNDTNSVGGISTVGTQLSTNNYTGIVEWDQVTYGGGDTATLTITDPDLNQDNGLLETYSNNTSTTFYVECINSDGTTLTCINATEMKIVEAGADSGTFVASFSVPSVVEDNNALSSTIGNNMRVTYFDSNDVGGGAVSILASASIASNTGSISLDKNVYPTPWGGVSATQQRCGDDASGASNCSTYYGNITIWVTVHEPDNSNDTLTCSAAACVQLKIGTTAIANAGHASQTDDEESYTSSSAIPDLGPLAETSQGSQDYEVGYTLREFPPGGVNVRVLSGSVIQAVYTDPSDSSGSSLEVYDSATFDMRNGSASFDKDTYVLGADMVVTITDPDLNIDSGTTNTISMDFLEWDSAASSSTLLTDAAFGCSPSSMTETGSDTGVFQSTCTFPATVASTAVAAGESVTLTYSDRTIAGENSAGDAQEDIEAYASSSNFGAIVELDRAVYSWTDLVVISVTAPDWNKDSAASETIGTSALPVQISSRAGKLCPASTYTLAESGDDTGVFTGEVRLVGYDTTLAVITNENTNLCSGPTSGTLKLAAGADGVTVSYEYSNNEVSIGSAITTWNIAEVSLGDSSISASGSTLVRMVDPDWDLHPFVINTKTVDLTSDSDSGGIQLTLTETDEHTGVFEGTLFVSTTSASSGSILRVSEGDTVTLEFEDTTLPAPYGSSDTLTVAATATVGTAFPPLERAPAANARVVDAFGNSVAEVSVDQQVQIAADVANGQSKDQSFAYLVQVQDSDGVTVSLSWITGSLTAGQSLSPAMSWIPAASGSYTATVFVWESVDNPTALSPTTSVTIDVV